MKTLGIPNIWDMRPGSGATRFWGPEMSIIATLALAVSAGSTLPACSWDRPGVNPFMGDVVAAEEHLHLALDIHGLDRKRTRAIVLADLGEVQLKRGNTGEALATWGEFVDCAEGVQSVRINDAVGNIAARLPMVGDSAEALELKERLTSRAPA